MRVPYIKPERSKDRNLHTLKIDNTKWVLKNMILRKSIIFEVIRMTTKYFLKHKLPFQYDPIFGNLKRISSIRLKTSNQRFRLNFKLRKKDYKRDEKKGWPGWKERKGIRRGRDCHPLNLGIIPQDYLCNALWRYEGCPYARLGCYGHHHIRTRW